VISTGSIRPPPGAVDAVATEIARSQPVVRVRVGTVERIRHVHEIESTTRIAHDNPHLAGLPVGDRAADKFRGIARAAMTDRVCQCLLERQFDLELASEDADLAPEHLGDTLGDATDGSGIGGNDQVKLAGRRELQECTELPGTCEFALQRADEAARFPQSALAERPRQLGLVADHGSSSSGRVNGREPLPLVLISGPSRIFPE
jgi:hypothetical protein